MPRRPTIDRHPKKDAIIQELLKQTPYRNIAKRYGVSVAGLHRYLNDHLLPRAAKEQEKQEARDGKYILREIDRLMARMNLLFDACDEFLRDPENPKKYWLGPRAEEIEVVYCTIRKDGTRSPEKRERLHLLLARIEKHEKLAVLDFEVKIADRRLLLLKTSEVLGKHLKLISEIQGLVKSTITINNIENWNEFKTLILLATNKHPEIRKKIVEGLKQFMGDAS